MSEPTVHVEKSIEAATSSTSASVKDSMKEERAADSSQDGGDGVVYPTSFNLAMIVVALVLSMFLVRFRLTLGELH